MALSYIILPPNRSQVAWPPIKDDSVVVSLLVHFLNTDLAVTGLRFPVLGACLIGMGGLSAPVTAQDWPLVRDSYRELIWIAGLSGESPDNGNEWNWADGRPATEAELSEPHSAMADLAGNVYVADKNAHAIRKIDVNGIITTVAGTNSPGYNGDGVATQCQLDGPQHAYVLPNGVFYILDTGNKRIRRVGLDGKLTTVITETANLSRGLWVSRDESLIYYCTDKTLRRWTPSMGNTKGVTIAKGFDECGNIDVAANGDIYVTDRGGSKVYRVPKTNTDDTPPIVVAGVGGNSSSGPGKSGDPVISLGLREVRGIAFHPAGGYFLATHRGGDIWYVDTAGRGWMFIEGNDGSEFYPDPQPLPNDKKLISEPRSISVALNGDLLIAANDAGYIRKVPYRGPAAPEPQITQVTVGNDGTVTLQWRMTSGAWYQIESTTGVPGTGWQTEVMAGPAAEALQSWSTSRQGVAQRLFRVREFRAWPN